MCVVRVSNGVKSGIKKGGKKMKVAKRERWIERKGRDIREGERERGR